MHIESRVGILYVLTIATVVFWTVVGCQGDKSGDAVKGESGCEDMAEDSPFREKEMAQLGLAPDMGFLVEDFWPDYGPLALARVLERTGGIPALTAVVEQAKAKEEVSQWESLFCALRRRIAGSKFAPILDDLANGTEKDRLAAIALLGWAAPGSEAEYVEQIRNLARRIERRGTASALISAVWKGLSDRDMRGLLWTIVRRAPGKGARLEAAIWLGDHYEAQPGHAELLGILRQYKTAEDPVDRAITAYLRASLGDRSGIRDLVDGVDGCRESGNSTTALYGNGKLYEFLTDVARDTDGELLAARSVLKEIAFGELQRIRSLLSIRAQYRQQAHEWWFDVKGPIDEQGAKAD